MEKIEVGMLVEIIYTAPEWVHYIGHRGIVLSKCHMHEGNWDIEGLLDWDGNQASINYRHIRPINPPKEELGSWDTIENNTGWNPTKQRETI